MSTKLRLGLLVALMAAVWAAAEFSGFRQQLSNGGVQAWVADAGTLGIVLYFAAFSVGVLAQIPGIVFLALGRIAFGPLAGFAIAYAGAVLAVMVSFFTARRVGGRALSDVKWPPARKLLDGVANRPVRTIALLRFFMIVSPPINVALALSDVRGRDYLLGSALGLIAPVLLWTGMLGLI